MLLDLRKNYIQNLFNIFINMEGDLSREPKKPYVKFQVDFNVKIGLNGEFG